MNKTIHKASWLVAVSALVAFSGSGAAPLALPDTPLFLPGNVPPLNMIVLGRDHKLYYEAYNDASDLDGDGVLDIRYKPSIDYYGYFDSYKCYTYSSGVFEPQAFTADKRCSDQWSGDFLNYLTTSRLDALRKVLYGGYRSTDTGSTTVLERSHVPQDAHSWGKEYTSVAVDGYNISDYTPLALPNSGTRHLFANTTLLSDTEQRPRLRYLLNQTVRIWNWVSIERPVAGGQIVTGVNAAGSEIRTSVTPTNLTVRVRVCVDNLLESNCRQYPSGNYKPIGLLQEFGENDSMYFGLLSGSYANNTRGGVLRRQVGSIRDEINVATNGTFRTFNGIVTTLDGLRVTGFGGNHEYSCGWIATRAINPGECQMWGNPIAEMMYETLRYFAGRGSPTAQFSTTFGQGEEGSLPGGGLPVVANWGNPYTGRPVCSKPFQTVVSDINPSYDTEFLPGSHFGSFGGDTLGGLNVSSLGQTIWDEEYGGPRNVFIGQSGAVSDGAPTPKTVTSFGNIRGLAPEEPTKQGGYYSASVAYHGRTTSLNTLNASAGDQNVNTFAVALASPLPRIEIPVGDRKITLVPFAKSVGGAFGITATQGQFQPTNQIVDFYVESLTPTSGRFRVNFEDVEQGADHDMDAIALYEYQVNGNGTVTVNVTSEYAAGSIIQHMGYIISGSTADGTYLVVRDRDTATGSDPDYFLDTPAAFTGVPPAPNSGTGQWNDGQALPLTSTRTFSPGAATAAALLKDPLWYAAKWGGFDESYLLPAQRTNMPDAAAKWDSNNDGVPDNYFLVTNALKLSEQLRKAFQDIVKLSTSASAASINSGSISSDTRVYQARFTTAEWTGQLLSYRLNQQNGGLVTPADWEASQRIPPANARRIVTVNSDGAPTPFRWSNDALDATRQEQLGTEEMLNYLRGDDSNEGTDPTQFRERRSRLGDIVSSAPLFVSRPPFRYRDSLESQPYSAFAATHANRRGMVYVGANDGMLHGFDAETGDEVFAFIPSPVFERLPALASQNYSHQFYVDGSPSMGDVFYNNAWHTVLVGGLNKGGRGIYALNITNPGSGGLSSAESNPSNVVMWEFTAENDADLGYTYSQPAIVRLRDGQWAAVFGNGYNSPDGKAVLYVVNIRNGQLIARLDTSGSATATPPQGVTWDNGLSTPAMVDLDGDRIVEYAYAGDLWGNMWKFDLSSVNPSDWRVAYGTSGDPLPLYQARDASGNAQPITVRPEVGRGPFGAGTIVLFGTGKYLVSEDKLLTPQRPQTFYGIVDRNSGADSDRVNGRLNLTRQEILVETTVDPDGDGDLEPLRLRVTTNNTLGTNRGWYMDLVSPASPFGVGYQAEKQVTSPVVRNGNVIFTTLIPDGDPCAFGGGSWIMELDMLSGSRKPVTPFDLNRDGLFDNNDLIEVTLPDGTTVFVPASGIGSDEGILQSPGVIDGEMGPPGQGRPVQYKYFPGSSGGIQQIIENPGAGGTGRQSWRQIR